MGHEVRVAPDGEAALRLLEESNVDVLLTDINMPRVDGLELLRRVHQRPNPPEVIMLTGHGTVEMCRRAFKAGAAEFLEKPVDDEQLLEALQHAVRQHVNSRERTQADHAARDRFHQLSDREREVFGLIVTGLTNKEIARSLSLSPRTVESHRANLFAKLETQSLAQLIRNYAALAEGDAP